MNENLIAVVTQSVLDKLQSPIELVKAVPMTVTFDRTNVEQLIAEFRNSDAFQEIGGLILKRQDERNINLYIATWGQSAGFLGTRQNPMPDDNFPHLPGYK